MSWQRKPEMLHGSVKPEKEEKGEEKERFRKALAYTFQNEGGFSNVKEDRGGPTNFGITIHDLSRWRKKELTADDVKSMTRQEAEDIYWAWYWSPLHLDRIENENVAIALFDRGVLNGLTGVSRHVRVVCGKPERSPDTAHFDPLIPEVNAMDPVDFVMKLADRCDLKHEATVKADPTQRRFLAGWKNRVNRMRRVLGDGTEKKVVV